MKIRIIFGPKDTKGIYLILNYWTCKCADIAGKERNMAT